MPEKTVPWWRRALNFALDGIRSGFGLFSRPAKPETPVNSQPPDKSVNPLEDLKEETVLPQQPANPEPLAARPPAEPQHAPEVEPVQAVPPVTGPVPEAIPEPIRQPEAASKVVVDAVEIAEPAAPPAAPEPAAAIKEAPVAAIETPAEPEPGAIPEPPTVPPQSTTEPEPVAEASAEPTPEQFPELVAISLNQTPDELPAPPEVLPIDAPEQYAEPTVEAELSVSEPEVPAPVEEAAEAPETEIAIQPESTSAIEALPEPEIEEAAQPAEPVPALSPDPIPPSETPVEAEPEPEIAAALEPVSQEAAEPEPTPESQVPQQAALPGEAVLPVAPEVEPAEEPVSPPVGAPQKEPAVTACADATGIEEPVAEPVPTQTEQPEQVPEPEPQPVPPLGVAAYDASAPGPTTESAPAIPVPLEPTALPPVDERAAARLAARQKRLDEADEQSPFSVIVDQVYDGPLDLLLDLIRKQDIDIYDIPIAKITAQFLAYVNQLKAGDVDVAGEFIYTASLLIHIKSKMLLPRAPTGPDDTPEDPRRELVERLLEHERFKNAAQMLQQKQLLEAATWTNPGAQEFKDDEGAEPEIAADTVDLVRIFRDILERARNRPIIDVSEDQVTVGQMIQFLARRLTMEDKPVALRRLLSHTRSERALIAMFLALLELVRLQAILLRQDRQFSEIFVKKHIGFDTVMNEGLINAHDDWK
jgi:segregation and condensation protein A